MRALLLAAAGAAAAQSAAPPPPAPPAASRLEAAVSDSPTARRLLVAAERARRVEAHDSQLPRAVDVRGGEQPEIVLDLQRLRGLPRGEAEAQFLAALARASIASPLVLVEAEQAQRQWTAQALAELGVLDPGLGRALAAAAEKPAASAPALSAAASFIAAFERSPQEAWWLVESAGALPAETPRLTDVEDLLALRGRELDALEEPVRGRYVALGGRRYHASLVRAARRLRGEGLAERLREALLAYDTVGVEPFRLAVNAWRRSLAR